MSRDGSLETPIAIIARCRMPPENWCGKSRTRSFAAGIRTRWRSGTKRCLACWRVKRRCAAIASSIWNPTRSTGLSEVIGSWKIIATSLPRNSRISSSVIWATSFSPYRIRPLVIFPGSGISRRIESAVIVLPDPDSPTMPTISPRSTSKLTPSTALTTPPDVKNWTRRSWTLRSGARALSPHPGIERVAQPITQPVESHQGQRERDGRSEQDVWGEVHAVIAVRSHGSPGGSGWWKAQPEKAEERLEQHRGRDGESGLDDDRAERVRKDMPQQQR